MTAQNATTSAAIKTLVETALKGNGITVARDRRPQDAPLPYVTVNEGISVVPDGHTPAFDKGVNMGVREMAQVDLWQTWRGSDGKIVERFDLPGLLANAVHGAKLATAPTHVFGMVLVNMIRVLEADNNVVHHALSVEIWRDL